MLWSLGETRDISCCQQTPLCRNTSVYFTRSAKNWARSFATWNKLSPAEHTHALLQVRHYSYDVIIVDRKKDFCKSVSVDVSNSNSSNCANRLKYLKWIFLLLKKWSLVVEALLHFEYSIFSNWFLCRYTLPFKVSKAIHFHN